MVDPHEIAGILTICSLLPVAYLTNLFWEKRRSHGVLWFILATVVAGAWAAVSGLNNFIANESVSVFLFVVVRALPSVGTIFLFLFVVEYTTGRTVGWRFGLPLFVVPALAQLALWTAPELVFAYEVSPEGVVRWQPNAIGLLQGGYLAFVYAMAMGMLVREIVVTEGRQRKQVLTLLIGYTSVVVIGPLDVVGLSPAYFDTIIVGLLIAVGIVAYGLDRYGLFTTSPIGKANVFDNIDDAVLVFNERDEILDMNPLAKRLFDVEGECVGTSKATVFGEHEAWFESLSESRADPDSLQVTLDGAQRHFIPNRTAIEYGRGVRGEVWVLRDTTAVKQRENDLDLVRQVFSRVFRHNIRNAMVPIRGHAESMQEAADGEPFATGAEAILDVSDSLLNHTEKAREIETLIERGQETRAQSLPGLVSAALAVHDDALADATLGVDVEAGDVVVVDGFERAIANAVENALEHNPAPVELRIAATTDDGWVTLVVEDDGEGIPAQETAVLAEQAETDLQHGSGVGLWLMKWYTEKSNGELRVENTGSGTRVEMTLPAAHRVAPREAGSRSPGSPPSVTSQ